MPPNIGIEVLNTLFQQYPGFREVRLIQIKNVAFIEYEEEYQAGLALSGNYENFDRMRFYLIKLRFDWNKIGRKHHTIELRKKIINYD